MDVSACTFATARLTIRPWASVPLERRRALVDAVLTARATRELPPHWRGPIQEVERWIEDRDDEAPPVVSLGDDAIGFLTLYADGADLRIGYVLGESWWGRGLATELVAGVVVWAQRAGARRLLGGVTPENEASIRVLTKNGFELAGENEEGVLEYARRLG